MSFALPPENDPSSLLGSNRYIGRGDGVVIVSSSGMGKSVLQTQWAVHCALGLPFMGIATKDELTSLIVQAEDSDGDVGETVFSCVEGLKLTEAQRKIVNNRVIFHREKVSRGPAFISRLAAIVRKVKPDLVWLNPLHAFAGCDIANATELGNFLRGGLNAINHEDKFAYMIVHHTPKPMTGKGVADKKWHEFMYDAAGSAELVNWARAVITLKPTETEGDFNLVLAKRGKRAGVKVELPGNGEGIVRYAITTKVPIKHSSREVKVVGRERPFSVVFWEPRKPDAEEQGDQKKRASPSQFKKEDDYRPEVLIIYVSASGTEPMTYAEIYRAIIQVSHISKSTLTRRLREMQKLDYIKETEDGRWVRTAHGDNLATERLKQIK
jgi:RecA-family ATPase